jgi:hypothetical protein
MNVLLLDVVTLGIDPEGPFACGDMQRAAVLGNHAESPADLTGQRRQATKLFGQNRHLA